MKRVFISSLPTTLTLALLRQAHGSVPRNPLIAEPLYLTKYIERMGTGTRDMISRCIAANLAEPEFRITDGFTLSIPRISIKLSQRESDQLGDRLGDRLGDTRKAIVEAMTKNSKISIPKLAKLLNMSTTAVEKNIRYLKTSGHIKRVGTAKGGYWEVIK